MYLLPRPGGGVRVEASDTGSGIPVDTRAELFMRLMFSSGGGRSGALGLVIDKRILQLHSSDIALLQQSAKSCVFAFGLETQGKQ